MSHGDGTMGVTSGARAGNAGRMRAGVKLGKVPTAAWVCLTLAFLGVLSAIVVLSVAGADGTELRAFLNIAMNAAMLVLSGGAVVYSGAAARNSQDAAEQTNGALDARIASAVREALDMQRAEDTLPGGEFRRG